MAVTLAPVGGGCCCAAKRAPRAAPRRRAAPRAARASATGAPPRAAPLRVPEEGATGARFAAGEGKAVFSEDFRVRCCEVDEERRATPEAILNLLQECAVNHAVTIFGDNEGGFATDVEMIRLNLMFVMSKMHLRLNAYPRWNDDVRVDTWFAVQGKLAARRDWMLYSADGSGDAPMAAATSTWLLVNTETRKLGRVPADRVEEYKKLSPTEPLQALEADEEKLPAVPSPEDEGARADFGGLLERRGLRVRRTDVDMNRHVNNVAYVRWLLETVPAERWAKYELCALTLEFRNECHLDDEVDSFVSAREKLGAVAGEEGEEALYHWLKLSGEGGKELMRAKTFWRAR